MKFVKTGFLFLFVIAVFWYVSVYSSSVAPERSFAVSGEGKVIAAPDVAELTFIVLTEGGRDLTDLQRQNTGRINSVIDFLKKTGIDDKDIKTQYYNISPRYQYFSCPPVQFGSETKPCPPPEIVGYAINQTVLVKVRDLNKAGDILSGAVDRGANTVSGPNFTIDDSISLQNEAREKAIKQAREKAKSMAKAGGFRLGKLISIQERVGQPYYTAVLEARGGITDQEAGPSIEPGSQEVTVNITLTYEIK